MVADIALKIIENCKDGCLSAEEIEFIRQTLMGDICLISQLKDDLRKKEEEEHYNLDYNSYFSYKEEIQKRLSEDEKEECCSPETSEKKKSKWFFIDEKTPPPDKEILVHYINGSHDILMLKWKGSTVISSYGTYEKVDRWAKIPKFKKDKNGK